LLKKIQKVLKNGIIYGVGTSATKFIGFLLLPSYLNIFTAHQLGILGIVEISAQVLITIFGLNLYSALTRFYWDREYESKQKNMFFIVFSALTVISLLMIFIFSQNSNLLSLWLFKSNKYVQLINLFLISSGLEILALLPATLMKMQEKPVIFSLSTVVKVTVTFVSIIYLVLYSGRGLEGIYEAQIIGGIVYFIATSRYIIKNIEVKFDFNIFKVFFQYSYPLVFGAISGVMLTVIGRYILDFKSSLEDVGVYSFGFKIANSIKVFIIISMQMAISPIIYKVMYSSDNKRFYSKLMTYSIFGLMFPVIGLSIFGYEIVNLMVNLFAKDNSLREAYTVIPIINFSGLFEMLIYCSVIGLHITKKTKIIAGVLAAMLLFNYILNIILIPIINIKGVAYSTLTTQIIYWIIIYYLSQKHYKIPFEINKVTKVIFIGAVICIASFYMNNFELIIRLPIKVMFILIFPVSLFLWNFFEDIELIRIKEIFNKWKNPLLWKHNINVLLKENNFD